MNEENMEALARVRAHGRALKDGAPHQQPIGADILQLCDLAAVQQPTTIIGTADAAEFERLTKQVATITAERDRLQGVLGDVIAERDAARVELAELQKLAGGVTAGDTHAKIKAKTKAK